MNNDIINKNKQTRFPLFLCKKVSNPIANILMKLHKKLFFKIKSKIEKIEIN